MEKFVYVVGHNYHIPFEDTDESEVIGVCDTWDNVINRLKEYTSGSYTYKQDGKISAYYVVKWVLNSNKCSSAALLYGPKLEQFIRGEYILEEEI